MALSSYNDFYNNCHLDAWLVALVNAMTSFIAGIVVFGTLGMLAEDQVGYTGLRKLYKILCK